MNDGIIESPRNYVDNPLGLLGNPSPISMPLSNIQLSNFNPLSIPGIVAWFDADDVSTFTLTGELRTEVAQWRAKGGRRFAVSQAVANNRPSRTGLLRGRASILFDGVNDFLSVASAGLANYFAPDKLFSVFFVGEMPTFARVSAGIETGSWMHFGSAGSASSYARSTPDTGQVQFVQTNDSNTNTGTVFVSNSGPAAAHSAQQRQDFFICSLQTSGFRVSTWRTHTVMACDGTRTPFSAINGASLVGGVRVGAFSYNRFTLGCFNPGSYQADFFAGRLAEIILYERPLSDGERYLLVRFLSQKYNNVAVPVL